LSRFQDARVMTDVVPRGERFAVDAVRSELQRILASSEFAAAPTLSRFLRYIVEYWVDHGDEAPKEYALGVEALQRGAAFDSDVDTSVRVHARRLRVRLARYYGAEGRDNPIRLSVPKGHYRIEILERATASAADAGVFGPSIGVLPFANMSGDPEQEYFSDGITEDIITDLSKVSALRVASRNRSFAYKGTAAETREVARALGVGHVLCGSVRMERGRVRISARLIDGETDNDVWADRYDRDAGDIFTVNDEISAAIVRALRLQLLPEERRAIGRRRTDNAEAHNLYLMARRLYVTRLEADVRSVQAIVRLCERATDMDPNYAQAWALMAMGYRGLRELGVQTDDGMAAVTRALELDSGLAEAHATKAYILQVNGALDEAVAQAGIALDLDADSYEANRTAARLAYQLHRFADAVRYYEKAARIMHSDLNSPMMLVSCHRATGDTARLHGAAEMALRRADEVLARDPNNPVVIAYSANALAALGEGERAKRRTRRALLLDPDNWNIRYNFACALNAYLGDRAGALETLEPLVAGISSSLLTYLKGDPDLGSLHADPRYQALIAAAEARLAAGGASKVAG
jgi:adenylate cyclase